MRIRLTVVIDLPEPEQWTQTFGIEGDRDIRRDVKSYIGNELQSAGVFGNGEVNATIDWT